LSKKEEEKLRLLFELVKDAGRSDRELSKSMKVSQPTVTRKRNALEKEGFIKEYTIIPNLAKMGYEIIAFTFLRFQEPPKPQLMEEAKKWTSKQSSVVFASDGEGIGMNSVMVSLHKDYGSYTKLINQLRRDWDPSLKDVASFKISIKRPELLVKPFTFKYLEKDE
jgi:DNA-binding Lrp family transcriptional regulator